MKTARIWRASSYRTCCKLLRRATCAWWSRAGTGGSSWDLIGSNISIMRRGICWNTAGRSRASRGNKHDDGGGFTQLRQPQRWRWRWHGRHDCKLHCCWGRTGSNILIMRRGTCWSTAGRSRGSRGNHKRWHGGGGGGGGGSGGGGGGGGGSGSGGGGGRGMIASAPGAGATPVQTY